MNSLNRTKSRLRKVIPKQQHFLVRDFLLAVYLHVVNELRAVKNVNLHVITPDLYLRDLFTRLHLVASVHLDEGRDLNELQEIILRELQLDSVIIVMADLPLLTAEAFSRFLSRVEAFNPDMAIVPSHDTPPGTSILYLKDVSSFTFQYGRNSYWNHLTRARELQYLVYSCNDHRLGFDIDTWDDLAELTSYLAENVPTFTDVGKNDQTMSVIKELTMAMRLSSLDVI